MWTVGEEFVESAGYMSRNLDEPYYVWDAINVVHNPVYEFKDDRVGTIFVEYEKIHDPLVLEDEFFCDAALCVNTMEVSGFLPWTGTFDYGGDNIVYNATSLDEIGEHEIKYIARLQYHPADRRVCAGHFRDGKHAVRGIWERDII